MRWIMLDTETTGLRVDEGHRLIEIGCVECIDRRITDRHFHVYLNPQREIDEGATQVHGMTWDQLKDKPLFGDVVQEFLEFIEGAALVIHNAEFDRGFLDEELGRVGLKPLASYCASIIDSLGHARELHPGQRNSLDALCQRYGISNDHRVLHGALLDSRLLAEVYLAMTRGQDSLTMDLQVDAAGGGASGAGAAMAEILVLGPTDEELAEHEALLQGLDKDAKGACVWRQLAETPQS